MKFLLGLIAYFALSLSPTQIPLPQSKSPDPHAAMHQIYMARDGSKGFCTAYATGPHTIMTADHCIADSPQTPLFVLDPSSEHPQTAIAGQIIHDGNDHVIIEIQHLNRADSFVQFDSWIDVSTHRSPAQGDQVRFWGAPQAVDCQDCFRVGYYSGKAVGDEHPDALIFVMPIAPGDSGALIFDSKDRVVGMISASIGQSLAASFEFKFSASEWDQASK